RSALVSTGLQDNGNVKCMPLPEPTPWKDIDGGDGGWNAFLPDGVLLHNTMSGPVAAAAFDTWGNLVSNSAVAITVPPVPGGLNGPRNEPGAFDVVQRPSYRNAAGQLLVAIGANRNQIYGLFKDHLHDLGWHWQLLATLAASEGVGAVGAFHGGCISAVTLAG